MTNRIRNRRARYLTMVVAGSAAAGLSLSGCSTSDTTEKASSDSAASTTSAAKAAPSAPSATDSASVEASTSAKAAPQSKAAPPAKAVPSATALYEQMRQSVAEAESVRIKGAVTNDGKKLTIDVAGNRDATNARVQVNDGSGAAELLTVGGNTYVKADEAFWAKNGSAAVAKVAAGKYVLIPAATGLMDGVKVSKLLDGVSTELPPAGALQKVEATELNRTPAYLLSARSGTADGKIYVSADGKANLLRIEGTKISSGILDFSEWNAVPLVSAPPAGKVLKIPGLP